MLIAVHLYRVFGMQESNPAAAVQLPQVLLLKPDTLRIRDRTEQSTALLFPIKPMTSNLTVADCYSATIHSVPSVACGSKCQPKSRRNHGKYSCLHALRTQSYQGCEEM